MRIEFKQNYQADSTAQVVDYLAGNTELSKMKIKKAIGFGGLWIKALKDKSKKRVKKIKTELKPGDYLEFFYDENLDFTTEELAYELYAGKGFGVWYKPVGLMTDSTPLSDRGCLSYVVKQQKGNCFVIHRLDRETAGLVIVAYNKQMAAFYNKEMQEKKIKKFYQAQVLGDVRLKEKELIRIKLDGKKAETKLLTKKYQDKKTWVEVELITGRFHQIRRHFQKLGNPVIGDPKYGRGNKNIAGLQLVAHGCSFYDPKEKKRISLTVDDKYLLF